MCAAAGCVTRNVYVRVWPGAVSASWTTTPSWPGTPSRQALEMRSCSSGQTTWAHAATPGRSSRASRTRLARASRRGRRQCPPPRYRAAAVGACLTHRRIGPPFDSGSRRLALGRWRLAGDGKEKLPHGPLRAEGVDAVQRGALHHDRVVSHDKVQGQGGTTLVERGAHRAQRALPVGRYGRALHLPAQSGARRDLLLELGEAATYRAPLEGVQNHAIRFEAQEGGARAALVEQRSQRAQQLAQRQPPLARGRRRVSALPGAKQQRRRVGDPGARVRAVLLQQPVELRSWGI